MLDKVEVGQTLLIAPANAGENYARHKMYYEEGPLVLTRALTVSASRSYFASQAWMNRLYIKVMIPQLRISSLERNTSSLCEVRLSTMAPLSIVCVAATNL
jgi:hypothetical protein